MKKIALTLCIMLMAVASAWAEGEITGLKIEMKDAANGYTQILFTDSPVLTHDLENGVIIITVNGTEHDKLPLSEVKGLSFVNIDETVTGVEKLFPQTNKTAKQGIYTLGGQKVNKVQKGQVYIINGTKVLVK